MEYPSRIEVIFNVPRELFPFEHRYVEVHGARVHYVDEGDGETVLMLHGNPAWCFLYRKIIAGLKSDFRCVALDFPGYGMSDEPTGYQFTPLEHSEILERFVDQLGLKDLTVMVQDWGGPIGFGLAVRRPELVRRFIIANTFAWPLEGERRIRFFSALMGGPVGRSMTWAFNFVPRFFFWRGFAQPLSTEVFDMYLAPWRERARRRPSVVGPRQLIAASDYLRVVEAGLAQLSDRPALIVWGLRDFAFREAEAARFAKLFPRNKLISYDEASHFLQEDVGDRIAAAFKEWISSGFPSDSRQR
jgi:haloalkane dehalogenase